MITTTLQSVIRLYANKCWCWTRGSLATADDRKKCIGSHHIANLTGFEETMGKLGIGFKKTKLVEVSENGYSRSQYEPVFSDSELTKKIPMWKVVEAIGYTTAFSLVETTYDHKLNTWVFSEQSPAWDNIVRNLCKMLPVLESSHFESDGPKSYISSSWNNVRNPKFNTTRPGVPSEVRAKVDSINELVKRYINDKTFDKAAAIVECSSLVNSAFKYYPSEPNNGYHMLQLDSVGVAYVRTVISMINACSPANIEHIIEQLEKMFDKDCIVGGRNTGASWIKSNIQECVVSGLRSK